MEKQQKQEYINFNHLKRLLTSQKYFVWNPTILNINEETDSEEFSFWQLDIDEIDNLSYAEVIKNGYGKVNQFFIDSIKNQAKKFNKNIFINKEIKVEIAFQKTLEAINNVEIDWIINPVFIFDNCIIKPILYRKDQMILSSLIHSSKTKLKNYIQAYFEINVFQKLEKQLNLKLKSYSLFNYDSKSNYLKAPDLKFEESFFCWTQKNGPAKETKTSIEDHNDQLDILTKVNSRIISESKSKGPQVFFQHEFDWYIKEIVVAKETKTISPLSEQDLTQWGENPNFKELFPFEELNLPAVSGSLIKKVDLLKLLDREIDINDLKANKKTLSLVCKQENKINFAEVKRLIEQIKNQNCIWYDFEGFSMPFVILANTKPYQQLVFQVSVIQTRNDEIINTNNLVIDPKTISVNDFKKIVDVIYDPDATKYVVYNQSYENTRLKEMKEIFLYQLNDEERLIYNQKINHIIDNTFDLLELFKITNANDKIPPIFLHKLLGFSSIKKLENLITNSQIQLPVMIKPYKSLEVQNGLMAMNKAIQRYLDAIGDKEWNDVSKQLKAYCENDVKAMIMVYHFVLFLLAENNY